MLNFSLVIQLDSNYACVMGLQVSIEYINDDRKLKVGKKEKKIVAYYICLILFLLS